MPKGLVFIVVVPDADPCCGSHFEAAFSTRQKAQDHIKECIIENDGWDDEWYIIEAEVN